jgi:pyridoxamine 5'-phosphate oxidase
MAIADENQESLEAVLSGIWKMLQRGVARFNDPFHSPVLATVDQNRSALRTVILRQFNLTERVLVCHTDSRANKVRQISNQADVCWLFYHPKKKVQLRISGPASLHTDDRIADEHWAATGITSRLNYCTVAPPGSIVNRPSSGLPDLLLKKAPTLLQTENGRKNFMVIAGQIKSLDWLQLSILGNRRARFDWTPTGLKANWLVP